MLGGHPRKCFSQQKWSALTFHFPGCDAAYAVKVGALMRSILFKRRPAEYHRISQENYLCTASILFQPSSNVLIHGLAQKHGRVLSKTDPCWSRQALHANNHGFRSSCGKSLPGNLTCESGPSFCDTSRDGRSNIDLESGSQEDGMPVQTGMRPVVSLREVP